MSVRHPHRTVADLIDNAERVLSRKHHVIVPFFAILAAIGLAYIVTWGILPSLMGAR
jgi:hypothetical protein